MPQPCQITRLPGGLTVASLTMPHMASVSVGLWIGAGGRHEAANLNGACHFIEHMLFKGTRRRTPREISQAVEGIGGYLNAFTGEETTCFYSRARHDHLEELVDVLTDMLLHSRFDPADVDKERNVIKEELAMYLDQPQQHVQELLNATLWPNHPLGRPLTGTPETLDQLDRTRLLQFMHRHYVASAVVVVAAGHVEHARLLRTVAPLDRHLPSGLRPRPEPITHSQTSPAVRLATKTTEQTQLAFGIRTLSRHDPRRYPLRLLNTLLGENMSSRLFQVVREDRGLAYHIGSSVSCFDDTGDLVISAGLDAENAPQVLRLVLKELRTLATRLPGISEFRRARDYVIGQMDLSLESTENQMLWIGEQLLGYGRVIPPATVRRRLAAVRPSEITRTAETFFRPDRFNLALVSPLQSAVPLERILRS